MQRLFELVYSPDGDGGNGQEPATVQPTATTSQPTMTAEQLTEELRKVRAEAAKHRTDKQALAAQVASLMPQAERLQELENAQKTEAQRLADSLARVEADLAATRQRAEAAEKAAKITRLAAQAGVPADLADMLDTSKLDLSNEAEVIERLKKFAPTAPPVTAGKPSSPAEQKPVEASYFRRAGQNVERIFGG